MAEALQASCATHAGTPAVATCRRCGLFLCDGCVLLDGDESYCAPCHLLVAEPASPRLRSAFALALASVALAGSLYAGVRLGFLLNVAALPLFAVAVALALAERRRLKAEPSRKRRLWLRLTFGLCALAVVLQLPVLVFMLAELTHHHGR